VLAQKIDFMTMRPLIYQNKLFIEFFAANVTITRLVWNKSHGEALPIRLTSNVLVKQAPSGLRKTGPIRTMVFWDITQ
jgi:hypothetical protein